MAKALLLLVVVAAVSALQYLGITAIIDLMENVPLWAVILSTGVVAHAITAALFTNLTGLEDKVEILKLKLSLAKSELNPIKSIVELMEMKHKHEVERAAVGLDQEVTIGVDIGAVGKDETVVTRHPGKGHMKGKKLSEETRRKISEKAKAREAAKREQKERMAAHRARNDKKKAVKNA